MAVTLGAIEPELRALAVQYACGVDRRDPDMYAGAFLDDGLLVVHRPGEGPDQGARRQGTAELRPVTEFIKQYYKTFHFIGQSLYALEGDVPTGEIYCIAHHLHQPDGDEWQDRIMYIRYHDRYGTRPDGRWGIAERHLWNDWVAYRPIPSPLG
jgi:hypothetical protein